MSVFRTLKFFGNPPSGYDSKLSILVASGNRKPKGKGVFEMKHGNINVQNGNQGNQRGTQVPPQGNIILNTEPAKEPAKEIFMVASIEDLLAKFQSMGGELSPEAIAELESMRTAQEKLDAPKRMSEAEAEVKTELPKMLEDIATKHKVSFSGRKVVIVFKAEIKEGEENPIVSFGNEVETESRKRSGGGGGGFKSHGEVIYVPETGKEMHFASFAAMAKAMGYKMEGRANATIAITNPTTQEKWDKMTSDERKALPTVNKVETKEVDGKTIQYVYPVTETK
ncbi:MAG: hypothetical protein PHC43_00290 [Candidatus Marinimicrobia bacterium]|jgi:hypothetical protein|nr:hypothetical protein [Candidatus Neomarinimicrobiota bacterium]